MKPLAVAAVLIAVSCTQIAGAQSVSSGSTAAKQANKNNEVDGVAAASQSGSAPESFSQTTLQQSGPAASATALTVNSTEIESLPASGRRWEEFVVEAPADSAQANGTPSSLNYLGPETSDVSVDGISLRRPTAPSTDSPARSSSGQGVAEPSGTGPAWSSRRGLAISDGVVYRVQTTVSDAATSGERIDIETRAGSSTLHGQAFLFDRQNSWGAKNHLQPEYSRPPQVPTPRSPSLRLRSTRRLIITCVGALALVARFFAGRFSGLPRSMATAETTQLHPP